MVVALGWYGFVERDRCGAGKSAKIWLVAWVAEWDGYEIINNMYENADLR